MRIGLPVAGVVAMCLLAANACGGGIVTKDETVDAEPPPSPTFAPAPGANTDGWLPPKSPDTCPDTGVTCE